MEIEDFIPYYPDIQPNFCNDIYNIKEYNELILDKTEVIEEGEFLKHQKFIARLLSSHTIYDKQLLIHDMGTGKTKASISAIEQIKLENNGFDGAVIIAKNPQLLENFRKELLTCTTDYYPVIDEDEENMTERKQKGREKKEISKFYSFYTLQGLSNALNPDHKEHVDDNFFDNKIIVIDEVHNIRNKIDEDTLTKYDKFLLILKKTYNCKIILLTGTPMKDNVYELPNILNLIIPDQLPIDKEEFKREYLDKINSTDEKISSDAIKKLKEKCRGYISFLRNTENKDIDVKYLSISENPDIIDKYIIYTQTMNPIQSNLYLDALQLDNKKNDIKKGDDKEEKDDIKKNNFLWNKTIQSSIFTYPDIVDNKITSNIEENGFTRYIKIKNKNYIFTDEFKKFLETNDNKDDIKQITPSIRHNIILSNIQKLSITYYDIIVDLLTNKIKGNGFVFCSSVKGSGCILLSLLLDLIGYENSNSIDEKQLQTEKKRYLLLTEKIPPSLKRKIDIFNNDENYSGKYIKLIIGSDVASEGLTFKNITNEYIVTPHWNFSKISQVLARGIRLQSHKSFIENNPDEKMIVNIKLYCSIPDTKDKKLDKKSALYESNYSIDLYKYKICQDKDVDINKMLKIMLEISTDCIINYKRNKMSVNKNNTRDCFYSNCDYKCDNIDMDEYKFEKSKNFLTYNLYYFNPPIKQIYIDILYLLKIYGKIDIENLCLAIDTSKNIVVGNLKKLLVKKNYNFKKSTKKSKKKNIDFNPDFIIDDDEYESDEDDDEILYITLKDFMNTYFDTQYYRIYLILINIFNNNFEISLNDIIEYMSNEYIKKNKYIYDIYISQIQHVLYSIISNKLKLFNKYGIKNYLCEKDNIYYLSDTYNNIDSKYYTENINIYSDISNSDITNNIINNIINNESNIEYILEKTPIDIKQKIRKTVKKYEKKYPELEDLYKKLKLDVIDDDIKIDTKIDIKKLKYNIDVGYLGIKTLDKDKTDTINIIDLQNAKDLIKEMTEIDIQEMNYYQVKNFFDLFISLEKNKKIDKNEIKHLIDIIPDKNIEKYIDDIKKHILKLKKKKSGVIINQTKLANFTKGKMCKSWIDNKGKNKKEKIVEIYIKTIQYIKKYDEKFSENTTEYKINKHSTADDYCKVIRKLFENYGLVAYKTDVIQQQNISTFIDKHTYKLYTYDIDNIVDEYDTFIHNIVKNIMKINYKVDENEDRYYLLVFDEKNKIKGVMFLDNLGDSNFNITDIFFVKAYISNTKYLYEILSQSSPNNLFTRNNFELWNNKVTKHNIQGQNISINKFNPVYRILLRYYEKLGYTINYYENNICYLNMF